MINFYRAVVLVALIGILSSLWSIHESVKPFVDPAKQSLATVTEACHTFTTTAPSAVKAVKDLNQTINDKWPRWLKAESEMAFGSSEAEVERWANEYVDRQESLVRGGADRPTRAEIRRELRTRFPALTLLQIAYWVFVIWTSLV